MKLRDLQRLTGHIMACVALGGTALAQTGESPGESKQSAIEVCSPQGQRAYLSRLACPDGSNPTFNRVGSFGNRTAVPPDTSPEQRQQILDRLIKRTPLQAGEPDYHVVDGYEVACGEVKRMVYMDMYHCDAPPAAVAPTGFTIRAVATAGFAFAVQSPGFRISIPALPQMKMEAHPLQGAQPHLRFLGSDGPYTISILTPTGDAGMTPLDCANSVLGSLPSRPNVPPANRIYKARVNPNTYAAIYAVPMGGAVQLHAHFMSAAAGTHCVEVHASRVSTSKDDLEPWFKGFGNASIEPN